MQKFYDWGVLLAVTALLLSLLFFAGCSTVPAVAACPTVTQYDRIFQSRLADEVAALPPGAALVRAMADYGALRALARACSG